MSYDLEIAAHHEPTRAQLDAWGAGQQLIVDSAGEGTLIVASPSKRGDGHLFSVDGPLAAEPDDFAAETAAACLAPRWMVTISVPYSSPKRAVALARSLARYLAEHNAGAAFDPQEDRVIWPRGKPKRVAPRRGEERTSKVGLEWIVGPQRWEQAPGTLLRIFERRCPEALPARYGRWEPPPHRFDPDAPEAFVHFLLDEREGDAFWFSARPSFGGWSHAPDRFAKGDERLRVARLGIDFDGRVLEQDARWRAAVVDLFVAGASALGAFFAAAQVEPGWTVTANNRLYATVRSLREGDEHFLRDGLWQGLPPVPVWLSWFGGPYRDLVAPHLTAPQAAGGRFDRLLRRRGPNTLVPRVESRPDGLFLQLGDQPRRRAKLGTWPLPPELTYRRDGAAALIPPLR